MSIRVAGRVCLIVGGLWCGQVTVTRSAAGQQPVQVVDPQGNPVPAVLVEAYGYGELLESAASDSDGRTILGTGRWAELRRISFSHIGYETLLVQDYELPSDGVFQLEPLATAILGLRVEAQGQLCPVDEDPRARQLWAEVARRYSPDTGTRGLSGEGLSDVGPVRESDLYRVDRSRLSPTSRAGAGSVWRPDTGVAGPIERFVETDGYSWAQPRLRMGQRYLNREYPALDSWQAYHFATPVFGEIHHFSVLSERDGVTRLAFCPNEPGDVTSILGEIVLVAGERFLTADWLFQTDDPNEGAGGSVTFTAAEAGRIRLPHLLAEQGIFFRHSGMKSPYPDLPRSYYREVWADIHWTVLPPGASR